MPQRRGEAVAGLLVYPSAPLGLDYLRGGGGLVAALAVLAFARPPWWVEVGLGGLCVLFVAFLWQTRRRQRLRLRLVPEGLTEANGTPLLSWHELDGLRLRFFGSARRLSQGWLELELTSGDRRVVLHSWLEGFAALLDAAEGAAQARGLDLDAATLANLAARRRGVPLGSPQTSWR